MERLFLPEKSECSWISWEKKKKNFVVIGYLRKIKKKTLKKQEPSVRILLVNPPKFF